MPVNGTITVSASINDRDAPEGGSGSVLDAFRLALSLAFADGTGALGVQVQFNALRAIDASGEDDLDLSGGLANGKGKAVTFTKVKALLVRTPSTNSGDITLKTDVTNGFTSMLDGEKAFPPGSIEVIATEDEDGWPVIAGTGDLMEVLGLEDDSYEIALWGEGSEA